MTLKEKQGNQTPNVEVCGGRSDALGEAWYFSPVRTTAGLDGIRIGNQSFRYRTTAAVFTTLGRALIACHHCSKQGTVGIAAFPSGV